MKRLDIYNAFFRYLVGTKDEISRRSDLQENARKFEAAARNNDRDALIHYNHELGDILTRASRGRHSSSDYYGTIAYMAASMVAISVEPFIGVPMAIDSSLRGYRILQKDGAKPVGVIGTAREFSDRSGLTNKVKSIYQKLVA